VWLYNSWMEVHGHHGVRPAASTITTTATTTTVAIAANTTITITTTAVAIAAATPASSDLLCAHVSELLAAH
jgi:hypothetical protein